MASNITLSAGVRSNLLNLQNTAELKNLTQTRLSTGKKVNSALDNPSNFFTAASLSSRASDLSNLLDGMANGIQTIQAANNGLSSITTTLQSMQSTLNQARQDKSFQTQSYELNPADISAGETISFSGGSIGTTPVSVALNTTATPATSATLAGTAIGAPLGGSPAGITIQAAGFNGGAALTIGTLAAGDTAAQVATKINTALGGASGGAAGISVAESGGVLTFTSTSGANVTLGGDDTTLSAIGFAAANRASTNGVVATPAQPRTVDQMVTAINATAGLMGKVTASNDNGKLRIQNLSTQDLTTTGVTNGKVDGSTSTGTVAGNSVRTSLAKQFNDLRDQLTKFGDDASFNGVNLLRGDNLKLTLNETGTSFINVQAKDKNGNATSIDNTFLKVDAVTAQNFDSDTTLDGKLDVIKDALSSIRSVSSSLGSQISSVQARKDFTKQMINTLQVGSDNLTLADTNEEGANLLALNTRQSLQTTSLSFASQADQAVLQFLR